MHSKVITLSENGIFRPSAGSYPAYVVSNVRVEDGMMIATISGGFPQDAVDVFPSSLRVELRAGESFLHPGVGTFTLLYVNPMVVPLQPGIGPKATFEFTPSADFTPYWEMRHQ